MSFDVSRIISSASNPAIALTDAEIEEFSREIAPMLSDYVDKMTMCRRKVLESGRRLEESKRTYVAGVVTVFYKIFYGTKKTASESEVDDLYQTYLENGCITVEESKENDGAEAKGILKLNSMEPIVQFLKNHADAVQCDLRPFKAEVYDMKTLSAYLLETACKVRAVAISPALPAEAKADLYAVKQVKTKFQITEK